MFILNSFITSKSSKELETLQIPTIYTPIDPSRINNLSKNRSFSFLYNSNFDYNNSRERQTMKTNIHDKSSRLRTFFIKENTEP